MILTSMELYMITLVIFSAAFSAVHGCGQLQPGREKTINFAVTDFKLPAVMVYYDNPMARAKVPTISTSKSVAETFVGRLIMQSDVLYEQGRSAFLTDNVILSILQQLDVEISYDPLECKNVVTDITAAPMNGAVKDLLNCIIVDGTVTNTCTDPTAQAPNCMMGMMFKNFIPIDSKHLLISGSLKTSNAIMANWSNQMWQNVLNRILRRIASGPYGSYFFGASVTLR